jgi:DNA-binding MarR family transcriptional regulator
VTLTRKGRRAYERLWAAGEAFRARLMDTFAPAEVAALLDFLGRVTRAAAPEGSRRPRRKPAAAADGP